MGARGGEQRVCEGHEDEQEEGEDKGEELASLLVVLVLGHLGGASSSTAPGYHTTLCTGW